MSAAMDNTNLMMNRAKAIAAMGMVERDYEGFNVVSPGIKQETFRVWRDEDSHVRCSCPEFQERIAIWNRRAKLTTIRIRKKTPGA